MGCFEKSIRTGSFSSARTISCDLTVRLAQNQPRLDASVDAVFDRVSDKIGAAAEVEFTEDVAHVVLGRLGRNEQLRADLGVAMPAGHELQHPALAVRQR